MHGKTLYLTIAGVVMAILLALGYGYFRARPTARVGQPRKAFLQQDYQVRIEGFRFFSVQEGRKILSLEAASFAIEKKKVGFFRIALSRTARLTDGRLTIFIETGGKGGSSQNPSPRLSSSQESLAGVKHRFPRLLSEAVLKDFPVPLGGITSVEVEPISVKIMEGESPVTTITASAAEVRLKNRELRFEGTVRVISGKKTLDTGELTFDPSEGLFRTDRPYRMTNGNEITSGKHLQTDIFLRPAAKDGSALKP